MTQNHVQDLIELDMKLVRKLLQYIFRSPGVIKVGFGLEGDLLALASALGSEGGGCISLLRSALDIRLLYKKVLQLGANIPCVTSGSLSGHSANYESEFYYIILMFGTCRVCAWALLCMDVNV
jgi:hypothetical protein